MAPLESLERDYPLINFSFVQFCASHAIFTVEDFLLHDTNALVASAKTQFNSNTLMQGIDQILSLIDDMHLQWSNGFDLLASKCHDNEYLLSEALQSCNAFLHGGLQEGYLTELVGLSSSGKTQVCLLAAVSVASVTPSSVIFIDTSNSFSAHRVAMLVNTDTSSKDHHKTIGQVLSNISCYNVFDVFTLFDVLHQIESRIKFQVQERQDLVRLLIVDSMSALIIPVLGGGGPNGHALMISLGYYLKKMALEYNLFVLVTNHMVGGEGGLPKPALGESWKTIPHVRLLLSRDRESSICNITLLKHPSMGVKTVPANLFGDP